MYNIMKQEIDAAVDLLCSYIRKFGSIKEEVIEQFHAQLAQTLFERYQGHWYPDKPMKGQAYRSLEFNEDNNYCDAVVNKICANLNFKPDLLGIRHELTLWVDPYEVSIRLGSHICAKDNQQIIVSQFDKNGNKIIHRDLDELLSQSRIPIVNKSRLSPSNCSPCDSTSNSGSSTPSQRASPLPSFPTTQPSMFRNDPLFTPPRALSPQAPVFQMSSTVPINVPLGTHPLEQSINIDESVFMEENHSQPERSDTPYSMHSTTSNESSDSGYCGYVESYPYFYKLNRLYKALALQKVASTEPSSRKVLHPRRVPRNFCYQQQRQQQIIIPSNFSISPPTPTPMNVDQLAPFFDESFVYPKSKGPAGINRKSKY